MNRRQFLTTAAVVTAAIALPACASAARIVGDGKHDDTDGLMALATGKPVWINPNVIAARIDGEVYIAGGDFAISGPIALGDNALIIHCNFRSLGRRARIIATGASQFIACVFIGLDLEAHGAEAHFVDSVMRSGTRITGYGALLRYSPRREQEHASVVFEELTGEPRWLTMAIPDPL